MVRDWFMTCYGWDSETVLVIRVRVSLGLGLGWG